MKSVISILIAFVMCVFITGCGAEKEQTSEAPLPTIDLVKGSIDLTALNSEGQASMYLCDARRDGYYDTKYVTSIFKQHELNKHPERAKVYAEEAKQMQPWLLKHCVNPWDNARLSLILEIEKFKMSNPDQKDMTPF